jgi:hypothetical protein
MPRASKKKTAEHNKALWERASNSYRQKWQVDAQKGYDFYLDDQLTAEEERTLEEAGMPTFTINRITPVIEVMKFFVTGKDPRWQAVAAEGSDADVAAVHSDIADYCWNLSNGKSLYSQIIQDSLVKGLGYIHVDTDPDLDKGLGEVVFKRIDPFHVYVDSMSRDFLFRDASYIIIKKDIPRSQLMQLLPDFKAKIKKASGQASNLGFSARDSFTSRNVQPDDIAVGEAYQLDGSEDEVLDYYEVYSKVKVPFRNLFVKMPADPAMIENAEKELTKQISLIKQEAKVALKEQILKIQQAQESGAMIGERAALEIEKVKKETAEQVKQQEIMLETQLKDAQTRTETYVVTDDEFKILMKSPEFRENLLDAIKFYDTRVNVSVTIGDEVFLYDNILPISEYPIIPIPYMYSGTPYPMSAVTPLIGKQQELNKAHQLMIHNANLASNLRWMYEEGSVPEEEWEKYSSSPGALLKYRQGFQPPTPVSPAPLNQAFFQITQDSKQDMEYMSGVYSSMQGAPAQQHDTYRGMLAVDEYGTRRVKAWMQTIVEPALTHLGKVFQQMAQAAYTARKVFRIVQPSGLQEDRQVEINIPIYNDLGMAIQKWNNYPEAKFDVKVVGGSTLPVNRWALVEEYFRWFQSGLIDDIAMIGQLDIRNKEQIIQRKSIYSQLKSQLEGLEGALKESEGTIDTLKRQLVQAGIKHGVDVGTREVDKEVTTTKSQQKMVRGFMQKELDLAKKDLGRRVDTAVVQFKAGLESSKKKTKSS